VVLRASITFCTALFLLLNLTPAAMAQGEPEVDKDGIVAPAEPSEEEPAAAEPAPEPAPPEPEAVEPPEPEVADPTEPVETPPEPAEEVVEAPAEEPGIIDFPEEDDYEYDYEEADDDDGPAFTVNGFLQNQTGIFVSPDKGSFATEIKNEGTEFEKVKKYPTNHGDKLGQLSMMRWTLQLEGDWEPNPKASLHWIFRGVRSLQLEADDNAAPPDPGLVSDNRAWVHDKYYTENALREFYVDLETSDFFSMRIGRQQVTWGDLGQYRLLDVVNPSNTTWHFGSLESFEDTRVPLWLFKGLLDVPALDGALEFVWIPMLDRPEDMVTTPLSFVGAWGLPPAPKQNSVSEIQIERKTFLYPDQGIDNSRLGARWKGTLGDLTYNLVYFWTHQLSPPVPTKFVARTNKADVNFGSVEDQVEVFLEYPRQHIMGLSLDYTFNHPIGTVVRFEAAFEPDRTYPVASDVLRKPDEFVPFEDQWTYLETHKKKVVTAGIQLMRPTFIKFINPNQTVMLIVQAMYSRILDFNKDGVFGKDIDHQHIIDVPGFDSTESNNQSLTLVFSAFTYYFHGLLMPRVVVAYIPAKGFAFDPPNTYGGGFASGMLNFVIGTNWRATLGYTQFWGDDPYKGVGLFRDRDEAYARLRYQF